MNVNEMGGTKMGNNLKDDTFKGGTDKSPAKRVRTEGLGLPMELPDLLC